MSRQNQSSIKMFSVYLPGGSVNESKRNAYKRDLRKLFSTRGSAILCGEFCLLLNWGCNRANAWGNILYENTQFFPISICYSFAPTYIPKNT